MSLLNNKIIKKFTKEVSKKNPEEQNKILSGLEAQLEKLPKKQRKRAMKLMGLFEKGRVLRPNEDVDNKKLILDNE